MYRFGMLLGFAFVLSGCSSLKNVSNLEVNNVSDLKGSWIGPCSKSLLHGAYVAQTRQYIIGREGDYTYLQRIFDNDACAGRENKYSSHTDRGQITLQKEGPLPKGAARGSVSALFETENKVENGSVWLSGDGRTMRLIRGKPEFATESEIDTSLYKRLLE